MPSSMSLEIQSMFELVELCSRSAVELTEMMVLLKTQLMLDSHRRVDEVFVG